MYARDIVYSLVLPVEREIDVSVHWDGTVTATCGDRRIVVGDESESAGDEVAFRGWSWTTYERVDDEWRVISTDGADFGDDPYRQGERTLYRDAEGAVRLAVRQWIEGLA